MADDQFDPIPLLQQISDIDRKTAELRAMAERTSLVDAAAAFANTRQAWSSAVRSADASDLDRVEVLWGAFGDARDILLFVAESITDVPVPPRMVSEADAYQLLRIRNIVDEDARARHGDLPGEPSWGVIADCVLGHASQHRQAREIMGVPEQFTLDQHVSEISRYLRGFEASRVNIGHWDTHPELPLDLLAREVVAQAERWRIDAEHYRGEASNATAKQVESLSAEVARLTGEVAATQAEAKRQIDRALLERNAAVASRDAIKAQVDDLREFVRRAGGARRQVTRG